jgi:DNA processing protein
MEFLRPTADVAYPPDNEELQRAIADRAAVVSEMPPGAVPRARHFPRRNRLISGLSLGVLAVAGAPQSGSLIPPGLLSSRDVRSSPLPALRSTPATTAPIT